MIFDFSCYIKHVEALKKLNMPEVSFLKKLLYSINLHSEREIDVIKIK